MDFFCVKYDLYGVTVVVVVGNFFLAIEDEIMDEDNSLAPPRYMDGVYIVRPLP